MFAELFFKLCHELANVALKIVKTRVTQRMPINLRCGCEFCLRVRHRNGADTYNIRRKPLSGEQRLNLILAVVKQASAV